VFAVPISRLLNDENIFHLALDFTWQVFIFVSSHFFEKKWGKKLYVCFARAPL